MIVVRNGTAFVRSFVIAGWGIAYSKPQCWYLIAGPMRMTRERTTYFCYTTSGNTNCCIGQDSVPAHHAHQTIKLFQHETSKFIPLNIWPPNSLDLSPVDYWIWGYRIVCIRRQFEMWPIWDSSWLTRRMACCRALWVMLLMNGVRDFRPRKRRTVQL